MNPLAVIILNWNGWEDTVACMESILKSSLDDFLIILIDNGSDDGSVKKILNWLKRDPHDLNSIHEIEENKYNNGVLPILTKVNQKKQRDLLFIKNKENMGYAVSNNIGIRYAIKFKCEKILLLNNDTIVTSDCFQYLTTFMDNNNKYSILIPVICYNDDPDKIWNAGGKLTWWGGRRYYYSKQYYHEIKQRSPFEITFATGCAMLIKTEIFKKYGMLTERFFVGEEDYELSIRMKTKSIYMGALPGTRIFHKIARSKSKMFKEDVLPGIFIYYLNRFIHLKDYYPYYYWIFWRYICLIFIIYRLFFKYKIDFTRVIKFSSLLLHDSKSCKAVGKDKYFQIINSFSLLKVKI